MTKKQEETETYVQISPYEIELTTSHVLGDSVIKEIAIRVSTPSAEDSFALYKQAVEDALLLRTLGK